MRASLKAVPTAIPTAEKAIDTLLMGIEAVSELMSVALNSKHQVVDPITMSQATDLIRYLSRDVQRLREGV